MRLHTDCFQCLCGAPKCRGWLGKTPQEFDLEKSGIINKKHSVQRTKLPTKPQTKIKIAPVQTIDKEHESDDMKSKHDLPQSGGRKRALLVDEFGLSASQKRLQVQAMEKFRLQRSEPIPNTCGLAPVAVGAKKRSLELDEFGLTAAQRQMQMQALAKLQPQCL
jgi:hypothetical protein